MLVRSSVFYHTVGCYKEPYREDHLIEAEEQIEDMNKRMQSQWSASGILEAPLDKVWEKLLDTFPMLSSQERSELERAGSPDVLKMSAGKHGEGRIHLEVDKNRHQVAVQGEWWYRGVYTLTPHTRGSLLVDQGWMNSINIFVCGLFLLCFAFGLRLVLQSGKASFWGPSLTLLCGVLFIIAAIFPVNPTLGYPRGVAPTYSLHG